MTMVESYLNTCSKHLEGSEALLATRLYTSDSVLYAKMQKSAKQVIAEVMDGRVHTVVLTEEEGVVLSSCTCGRSIACMHGRAAALYLQSRLARKRAEDTTPAPTVGGKKSRKSKRKPTVEMRKTSASRYRHIPGLVPGCNYSVVTEQHLSSHHDRIAVFKARLLPSNEVLFTTSIVSRNSYYWQNEKKAFSVNLRYVDNGPLEIKCNNCESTTGKLCKHQSLIIQYAEPVVSLFVEGGYPSYDEAVDTLKKEYQLSQEQFAVYYEVGLFPHGVQAIPRESSGLVMPSELLARSFVQQQVDPMTDYLRKLERRMKVGYGLLWSQSGCYYLSGKLSKDGATIKSGMEVILDSQVYDPLLMRDTQEVVMAMEQNDQGRAHQLLKDNLGMVASHKHYYYPDSIGYQNIKKSMVKALDLQDETLKVRVIYTQTGGLMTIELEFFTTSRVLPFSEMRDVLRLLVIDRAMRAYLVESLFLYDAVRLFGNKNKIVVPLLDEGFDRLCAMLQACDEVVLPDTVDEIVLTGGLPQLWLNQVERAIVIEPVLTYDDERFGLYGHLEKVQLAEGRIVKPAEEDIHRFKEVLEEVVPGAADDLLYSPALSIDREVFYRGEWFLDFYEKTKAAGIEVYGEERLESFKYSKHRAAINVTISSGIDWFDTEVEMSFGDIAVPAKDWIAMVTEGKKYIKLSDGTTGILPTKWVDRLKKIADVAEVDRKGDMRVSKLMFNVVDDLFDEIDDDDLKAEIDAKKAALANYDSNKKYDLPQGITATLRPYQKLGYQWMKFLEEYGFGGCLADDMGLGKTLQVISILVDQKDQGRGTSLVVIPRSLLFNWAAEIDKFAPQLTYQVHHGTGRDKTLESYGDDLDIIISTYDTVGRDIEVFSAETYNYVVLDESQAIKNPSSQRYKAMRLLKGRQRLAMTGTPIENNTFDLYAQLSFLNPGLLGSAKAFKDRFATPIDGQGNMEKLTLLKKLIHPFMLRRTKENVAADLPDKTETIIYCEMGKTQRKLYDDLKATIRQDIEGVIEQGGINRAKFKILDGLLRLRQLCNAPALVNQNLPTRKQASVKIDTLVEHIEDLGDHKALVFSQFTGMLAIIKDRLDKLGITYAYLDGSTRDRQQAVADFMEQDDCRIFLISIKAGNTGLNLTKADYVYIVDPWWNPAVEAQAIDRTHRIGQDQHVFAYKMICKDTIEEKIVLLQAKKKKLAQDLIQIDENVFKSLDKQELMALFD